MGKIEQTSPSFKISDFEDKSLLIVDDDDPLRGRLARALEKKIETFFMLDKNRCMRIEG